MSNTQEKNSKTLSDKIIFDDSKFSNLADKQISYERSQELEKTIGVKIMARLEKEFSALGYEIPKK